MKHNTSSLFKLLLTLVLIVAALLPQRAEAASSSLSGDSTVQAGSTVTLTLSISGSNVMGIEATLEYDSNTLEFTNYDQKISGWTMDYNSNHFLLYGVSNPINSSTGVLTVTFRVKSGLASGTALTAGFKNIVVSDGSKDETVSGTSWTGSVATPPSSNCDLSSLTCSNATLSPAFNKSTTNYTATVPYAVESLNLSYKAADGSARVSVSGNTLVVGSNTITVTCTAATGAKKNYTITVTREQDPNYKPSTDALLKELTLDVGYLSPTFSGAVTEYVAYVPYETRSATLSGAAKDEKALKVTEATMQLSQEGDNVMTVTCTAEDGTTSKTYTVHVYRMPKYEGIIPTMTIVDPNTPPEPPTYSIPMTVTLPLVGEMATSTAAIIGAALLVVILLLVGFLLGRIGHNGGGYDDDGDSGDDDDRPPQPPRPDRNAAAQNRAPQQSRRPEPVKAAPAARPVQQSAPAQPVRKAAPAAPARPQQRKVSDDTLTSPFVEDLSGKMQQEIAQRQAAEASRQAAEAEAARQAAEAANPAAAANEKVGRMSLDELLNDIHNM